jgi:hypothetical protein
MASSLWGAEVLLYPWAAEYPEIQSRIPELTGVGGQHIKVDMES